MYFLEPKSRWSPGLHTFIRGSEGSDPECSFSDSAPSSESDNADILDDGMDLDIPVDLESPEVVRSMLHFVDSKPRVACLDGIENVLHNFANIKSLVSPDYNSAMFDMVPPNEIFNIKLEPVEDVPMSANFNINPVQQRIPLDTGFTFSEANNQNFEGDNLNMVADNLNFADNLNYESDNLNFNAENLDLEADNLMKVEEIEEDYSLLEETVGNIYAGLTEHEVTIISNLDMSGELNCEQLVDNDLDFNCPSLSLSTPSVESVNRTIPNLSLSSPSVELVNQTIQTSSEISEYVPDDFMSESEILTNEDPFIGQHYLPKKPQVYIPPPPPPVVLHKFLHSSSTEGDKFYIGESTLDLSFTHSYCKVIKIEPASPRVPARLTDTLKCHNKRAESPVSRAATPVHEVPAPVKRRPGRPRKNPAPNTCAISVPKAPATKRQQKRTAPNQKEPPIKKAKLTHKSPACNEKRLQHNELERNRRDAMRQSMEGVEQKIPDRILQLTQMALYRERNEKSEEVENNFTVEVFRLLDELIKNKDDELKNVKCRKVNTKKGTKFPKMVVLLSAAFYVSYLEKDIKSKEHKVKKNEQILRHMYKSTKKVKRY